MLPAVDRIYTVKEGKGITGALCGGKPCADPETPDAARAKPSTH
jgi:hypothetical protein